MRFLNEVYCRFLAALLALVTPSIVNRPEPKTKEFVNSLTVAYRGGKLYRWKSYNTKEGDDITVPWEDFYTWYFDTKLPSYVMKSPDQHLMLVRNEITSFEVFARKE
jgi:hypothetical protein